MVFIRTMYKEYPGVVALKDVTLQLRRGEVLGLIGENGAGKSTLIKCCSGAVIPTSGKIKINGKEFDRMTPQLAAENGIAIIYQEFNNVGELSAAENLFLGREPVNKLGGVDRPKMIAESERPLVICGGGVVISRADKEFLEFVTKIDAPTAVSMMGGGGISGRHSMVTGMIGMHGSITACSASKFVWINNNFNAK